MRTLEQTDIELPQAVARWVRAAAADDAVVSAVLFGSRAHHQERPGSDWDLAIVVSRGETPSRSVGALGELNPSMRWHGIVSLAADVFAAQRNTLHTLANEVAGGVLLCGVDWTTEGAIVTDPNVESGSWTKMTAAMWEFVLSDIRKLFSDARTGDRSQSLGKGSADAAEMAAKTLCLCLGVSYKWTHDLEDVAGDLPEEWREAVRRMNGHVRVMYAAHYGDEPTAEETPEQVAQRLTALFDVVVESAKSLQQGPPLTPEDAQRMQRWYRDFRQAQYLDNLLDDAPAELRFLADGFERAYDAQARCIDRRLNDGPTNEE